MRYILISSQIFLQKGQENFSQWAYFSCFERNILIFSWFENIFLESRKFFSMSFEGFAVFSQGTYNFQNLRNKSFAFPDHECVNISKGLVNLIQRVKIAHSLLQSVSNLFHFLKAWLCSSTYSCQRIFWNLLLKNGEIGVLIGLYIKSRFSWPWNFTQSFHLMWKVNAEFSFTPNIYCLIWIQGIFSAVINTKQRISLLKLWIRIQHYTAADFQG